jgi:hypothetical protein
VIPGIIAITVGLGLTLFARAIQRDAISMWSERKGDPIHEFMKAKAESEATVIWFRVFGSFLVLLGVAIVVSVL